MISLRDENAMLRRLLQEARQTDVERRIECGQLRGTIALQTKAIARLRRGRRFLPVYTMESVVDAHKAGIL